MASEGWTVVSRRDPCPICDGTSNCTVLDDGGAVYCGRRAEGSVRTNDGGQFLHFLEGTDREASLSEPPLRKRTREETPRRDFGPQAELGFSHPDARAKRSELAADLGVEESSLRSLGVGWDNPDRAQSKWTVPEKDETGNVIGIQTRLVDGEKRNLTGSKRGLTYPENWEESLGPIHIVEGASDTAALLSMGHCAIGRPSNSGGVDLLAKLLRNVPESRRIIVLGENDRKPHESLKPAAKERHDAQCEGCSICWPGEFGAKQVAARLSKLLCRDIEWSLPADGFKDAREWYRRAKAEAVS